MKISFIRKINIGNTELEELLTKSIGDGNNDICIDVTKHLKELDDNNDFGLGNVDVDGAEAIMKLGAVYLTGEVKQSIDTMERLYRVIPSFKYTYENGDKVSTLEYIKIYNQFSLKVEINGSEKELIICTYVEAL